MLVVVPTSVCGREKRHSVTGAASHESGRRVPANVRAVRTSLAPVDASGAEVQDEADRDEGGTGERAGREAQQAPRRPWLAHVLHGARGRRGRPSLAGAAGDCEGVRGLTGSTSPRRRQPEFLDLFEAGRLEPAAVLN